jgi:hypothetical protein
MDAASVLESECSRLSFCELHSYGSCLVLELGEVNHFRKRVCDVPKGRKEITKGHVLAYLAALALRPIQVADYCKATRNHAHLIVSDCFSGGQAGCQFALWRYGD